MNEFIYTKGELYKLGTTLEPKACKVFLIMFSMADDKGFVDTSLSDLSKRSGMSITTIRKAIEELKGCEILEVNHNVGVATDYRMKTPIIN
ncbi:helix-turn-helix domain-containing protein [Priestia aryabhattai]|uniref:helix-turn-helix domain-containing protein n=1 Tax=Priestia aryabhattai TaxID=412384 RepID=UPI001C8E74DF|nr:helix-turn-helix domain-containing protein [Priestia aryabhattai]MBX9999585.1 helix-turn-helix domain-containing protein [Priestia aryabhattai]